MEEEYRKHKTSRSVDGSAGHQTPQTDAQDEASTRAIRSPGVTQSREESSGRTGYGDAQLEVSKSPIPTIRISTESDHEREKAASQAANGKVHPPSTIQEESEGAGQGEAEPEVPISLAQTPEPAHTAAEAFPEPQHAANGEAKGKQKVTLKLEEDEAAEESELSFSNKRLCERWLDNLFMVLYEVSLVGSRSS